MSSRITHAVRLVSFEEEIRQLEERLISEALIQANGDLSEAAYGLQLRLEALMYILRRHPKLLELRHARERRSSSRLTIVRPR